MGFEVRTASIEAAAYKFLEADGCQINTKTPGPQLLDPKSSQKSMSYS